MLFKYVVSGTPTTREDVRQDIAKLLSGELSVSNLSTNCDQALSGFVAGETKPSTYFTIHLNDGTDSLLTRPHSQDPTKTIWIDIRCNADELLRFSALADGTSGIRTNSCWQYSSTSVSYQETIEYLTTGTVFYIAMNDWGVFYMNDQGVRFGGSVEIWEVYPNIAPASYANSDPSMVWSVSLYRGNVSAPRVPRLSGISPDVLASKYPNLSDFSGSTYTDSTYTDNAQAPAYLPDGGLGIPLMPVVGDFTNGREGHGYWQLGKMYQSRYDQLQSIYGLRLTGPDVGSVLVVNNLNTVATTSSFNVYFLEGL